MNGISAGPIKTLAAAGIGGFRKILNHVAAIAPLRRNVTIEDVGNTAAFLCSDLAAGITGEIIYVDGGFSTVGMAFGRKASRVGPVRSALLAPTLPYSNTLSFLTIFALRSASST